MKYETPWRLTRINQWYEMTRINDKNYVEARLLTRWERIKLFLGLLK